MSNLRKILFEAYKDYGDKRIKNPDKVQKFVVDYRVNDHLKPATL